MVSIEGIVKSLLDRIAEDKNLVFHLNPQDLSSMTLGMVGMRLNQETCHNAVNVIIKESINKMNYFPSVSIANLLRSLAILGYQNINELCVKVDEITRRRLYKYEPRHIASILHSFVKLNYLPNFNLFKEIEDYYIQESEAFDMQAACNLLWSMAKLRFRPNDDFMSLFYDYCESNIDEFIPMEISNITYAMAMIAENPKDSFMTALRH